MAETVYLKAPVKIGQELLVVPSMRAKADYFVKIDGFVLFLKEVTEEMEGQKIFVKVKAVKDKYAFAYFARYADED